MGAVGLFFIALMAFLAIFGPLIVPKDPLDINAGSTFQGPEWYKGFVLGADHLGRDNLSRIIIGSRSSISIAVISVVSGTLVGVVVGLISGFYADWRDAVLQRLIDVMLSFPILVLALAIVAVLGKSQQNVIIAIAVIQVPITARVGPVGSALHQIYGVCNGEPGARSCRCPHSDSAYRSPDLRSGDDRLYVILGVGHHHRSVPFLSRVRHAPAQPFVGGDAGRADSPKRRTSALERGLPRDCVDADGVWLQPARRRFARHARPEAPEIASTYGSSVRNRAMRGSSPTPLVTCPSPSRSSPRMMSPGPKRSFTPCPTSISMRPCRSTT